MSNDKLVSIVVPVYGVEKYLRECLDSLINQTYHNLEIILVDDESPDGCFKICDEYAIKDKRIKVIHQKNGGAANAKNNGLKQSTGEYIIFVDSDDILPEDSVEIRLKFMETEKVDIVQGGMAYLYTTGIENYDISLENSLYSKEEFLNYYLDNWENAIFCNKMFRKRILHNIFFIEGRCIDDEFFTYKTILNSSRISLINKTVYIYRMRKSSIMHSGKNDKQIMQDQIDFMNYRYNDIKKLKVKHLSRKYLSNLVDNYIQLLRKEGINYNLVSQIKYVFRSNLCAIVFTKKHLFIWTLFYLFLPKEIIVKKKRTQENVIEQRTDRYYD